MCTHSQHSEKKITSLLIELFGDEFVIYLNAVFESYNYQGAHTGYLEENMRIFQSCFLLRIKKNCWKRHK